MDDNWISTHVVGQYISSPIEGVVPTTIRPTTIGGCVAGLPRDITLISEAYLRR